jgi:hypothetical protein
LDKSFPLESYVILRHFYKIGPIKENKELEQQLKNLNSCEYLLQEMNPIICFRQVKARFRQNYSTALLLSPASITTSKEQRVVMASVVCCSALPPK